MLKERCRHSERPCDGLKKFRHAVWPSPTRLSSPFEERQESAQRIAQIQQHLAVEQLRRRLAVNLSSRFTITRIRVGQLEVRRVLRLQRGARVAQMPSRPRYRKTFVV